MQGIETEMPSAAPAGGKFVIVPTFFVFLVLCFAIRYGVSEKRHDIQMAVINRRKEG